MTITTTAAVCNAGATPTTTSTTSTQRANHPRAVVWPEWAVADLRRSGLTPADVTPLGWCPTPDGYAIEFRDPATGAVLTTPAGAPFTRTRLAKPGPRCKYLSPKGAGQYPFILAEVHHHLVADPHATVVLSEGEKKVLAATLKGLPVIGLTGIDCWSQGKGSRKLHDLLARYAIPGRHWVMLYDSDGLDPEKVTPFDRSASRLAAAVEAAGCEFRRAFVPPGPGGQKQGLDDWLLAGATVEDLVALVANAVPASPRKADITLPGGSTSNLECVRAVAEAVGPHHQLFIRGGELVALTSGETGAVAFEPLGAAAAASELERFATFARVTPTCERHATALTEQTARVILAAPEFARRMPHILRICDYSQPCRGPGGKIVLPRPGYDPELRTYTNPGAPTLEKFATPEGAVTALAEIIGEFCFERPEAQPELFVAAGLAYLLTAHCRLLFEPERAPIFYAGANRPGCGKDFLLGLAPVLTTGSPPEFHAPAKDADESRKRLFAVARSGARFYLVSNIRGFLDDTSLEAAATSPTLADRVLGASTAIALPNTAVYAFSGNGLAYTEDLARRCIRIQLAYFGEEVETRRFSHPDLYDHVLRHRGRYLGALQSLVDHWLRCGGRDGSQPKASFTRWAAVVGGILEAAGLFNPIGRDEIVTAPTEEVQHLRRLLAAWQERHGEVEVDAAQVREMARDDELFGWLGDLSDRAGQTKFSRLLSRNERRSFGGLAIAKRADGRNHTFWRCRRAEA